METQILAPVEQIKPNPYQPRQAEDLTAVTEIAESIRRNGLIQTPVARQVNGHYELAFGHTRLAAFKMLQEETMPLIVRELDDLQMFELGVSENIKRRDLNPIEQAESMKRYMAEFKKNSVETGEFFNVSPEKVRNAVRLLNLPAALQSGVANGSITQNNARRLLTIQRVAPEEAEKVANKLKGDADPDRVIGEVLKYNARSIEMWQRWQSGEPLAGAKLWKLTLPADKFPKSHLPDMKAYDVLKALDIKEGYMLDRIKVWLDCLITGEFKGPDGIREYPEAGDTVAEHLIKHGAPADLIEKTVHLLNPPSCTACPFYAKVDGSHYCTFKACHTRKKHAWEEHVIQSASKRTGIALYNKKADGDSAYLNNYDDDDQKLFETGNADLRLKRGTNWSQRFDGIPDGYSVVVVGETLKKIRKDNEKQVNKRSQNNDDYYDYYKEQRRLSAMREANEAAVYEFLWNVAAPAFEGLLAAVTNLEFLKEFSDRMVRGVPAEEPNRKTPKSQRQAFYQHALLFSLLSDDLWDICQKKKPVSTLAKQLQGKATTWGVKLPRNWMDQAAEADKAIKIVSTETAKVPA